MKILSPKICAEVASSLNLNWQEKRSEVRRNSSKGTYLTLSLQCLDNNDVLLLLESILQSSKEGTQKVNAARGLRAVQEHLMYGCGYIDFEEARHLYLLFSHLFCPDNKPSDINCLMEYTVCLSMSLLNPLSARSLLF